MASENRITTIDANEAVAQVAHKLSEVIAIYPITPSSPMGEHSDVFTAQNKPNLWGTVPSVMEMQSEGGAVAALHGAAQTGALTTTFTASQGLLLMIPTMYKLAGELTPTVFHVTARSLAVQALSIFGDHSDVMAVRATGFAMLVSSSVQESMDMALVAHAAALESRIPFMHFFDGFRTSHEVMKIEALSETEIRSMIEEKYVMEHRARAMNPEHPVLRGTSQNPDVYFQAREVVNRFYDAVPGIVEKYLEKLGKLVGRSYRLFDYYGAPDAERVIVVMASGGETARETAEWMNANSKGCKVGVLQVRLFRPFSVRHFVEALPRSVKKIAVLDRTKEPGSIGEPLYLDCLAALSESGRSGVAVVGGRYGLSSKEFTPAMVKGIYDELAKDKPKNHFTIGINDDVTRTSLSYDPAFDIEPSDVVRCLFYGLGADGTVSANKNSIKIIGEETSNHAQGYFVYDSKKAGAVTISHLRFGPRPIRSTYLIGNANFVACHQSVFLERYNMLEKAAPGAVFLLNSNYGPAEVWDMIPAEAQKQIVDKKLRFFVIDAYKVAKETDMGVRINTIMQTCFFAISGVLPRDEAIAQIKKAIKKTYGKKGEAVVQKNFEAVDQTIANLHEVKVPGKVSSKVTMPPAVSPKAPPFVRDITAAILAGKGDDLPVSKMPIDGTFPTGTTKWEKRNIAQDIPVWNPAVCVQCAKCNVVCPHAAIRLKVYDQKCLNGAPKTFKSAEAKQKEYAGLKATIQIAPEDCTGCGICVEACPAKDKDNPGKKAINMASQPPLRASERENYEFFLAIPDYDRSKLGLASVKGSQLCQPLFEYSGACAGCGETPYVKLISQLFGDRAIIANATGCSSIYGGNLPTTPYTTNSEGRGPTWNNSLFEDCSEFGLGFRLTVDKHAAYARELLAKLRDVVGAELADAAIGAAQRNETELTEQRGRVAAIRAKLKGCPKPEAAHLLSVIDNLVQRSVWILGGDGWAYDIGYGGLDHVLASGRNVNVLVMDTEVYSNTGGQMSKSTPRGAVAQFAAAGKQMPKKDLAMITMSYGNIYVAKVAMGANDAQAVKAFVEAESYDGPSIIIAYSHCIAHGIDMRLGLTQQKAAVASGHWPLLRYDPRLAREGKNPLQLDSKDPSIPLKDYVANENRFQVLAKSNPAEAERLIALNQEDINRRWTAYKKMAEG